MVHALRQYEGTIHCIDIFWTVVIHELLQILRVRIRACVVWQVEAFSLCTWSVLGSIMLHLELRARVASIAQDTMGVGLAMLCVCHTADGCPFLDVAKAPDASVCLAFPPVPMSCGLDIERGRLIHVQQVLEAKAHVQLEDRSGTIYLCLK